MVVMVKNFDKSLFNLRNTSVHVSATNYYPEQLALQSSSFGYIFRKYLKIIGTAIVALHAVARAPYDDRLAAPLLPFQLDVVHGIGPSSSPGKFRKAHLPPTPGSSLLNATRLLPLFALSNVAVHNHMLFRFASFVANDAGNGFQHHPIAILVTKPVFKNCSCSRPRPACFLSSLLYALAVFGMNRLEPR